MKLYEMADAVHYNRMTTAELRERFLVEDIAVTGALALVYVDLDRMVIGFATPTFQTMDIPCPTKLRSKYLCECRELGVLNVGGSGVVTVDGNEFPLVKLDCLYVGRESHSVSVDSKDASAPARFYLLSYPARADYPTGMVKFTDLTPAELGTQETCNHRKIYKAIHLKALRRCQLVMDFPLLETGSTWNTMRPHTHMRRSEIYMYFDVDPAHRVLHLMGPPDETKHLVIADKQVAASPGWSIHAGVDTRSYGFCLGMGGENQRYDDMDPVTITDLN